MEENQDLGGGGLVLLNTQVTVFPPRNVQAMAPEHSNLIPPSRAELHSGGVRVVVKPPWIVFLMESLSLLKVHSESG